jgi:DHA2 family multidrug resistance protein
VFDTYGRANSAQLAMGDAYRELVRQANMLSYQNAFWVLSVTIAVLVPIPYLMKRPPVGGRARGRGGH